MLKEYASVTAVFLSTKKNVGVESLITLYFKENIPDGWGKLFRFPIEFDRLFVLSVTEGKKLFKNIRIQQFKRIL